jgi:membrane protease YdiL (CAAX protease family)
MTRGLAYGGVVLAIAATGLLIVGAIPATSGALNDSRVHVGIGTMLFEVLIAIPFGTVILEELAFRGTLLGLLHSRLSTPWAVGVMAVLFGLWHVKGVLHNASGGIAVGTVIGTVIATTIAGVGFGWLRVRSDSLLAPILAHIATNSLTFAIAWAFWH